MYMYMVRAPGEVYLITVILLNVTLKTNNATPNAKLEI